MITLYEDPHYTFRFADDRLVPRFRLEGASAGRRVTVFALGPDGGRAGVLALAAVGADGWVDLPEPLRVRAGDGFVAVVIPTGG